MSAPLISDATLATIVRIITLDNESLPDVSSGDCMRVLRAVTQDKHADALDWARRDGFSAGLIRAIDEANEEAARTHDERERERYVITPPDAKVDAVVDEKDPTTRTAIEPYPARNGCTAPRCSRCGGCGNGNGSCASPCGPCATCNESPAPLTMVIVNERAGQRHETTVSPDGCVDTKVTAYCAGCARGDGVADHTCEAAERARTMVVPHPNCSPDEPAAVKIWRARAAILQEERDAARTERARAMVEPRLVMSPEAALTVMRAERDIAREERDAARAELAATKKKLQGIMFGGGKRRRK